eukprot:g4169.t1
MVIHDRRHKCPMCPKTFSRKENLQAHLNKHNDVRNYPCEFCHKKFFSPNGLAYHAKKRHGITRLPVQKSQAAKVTPLYCVECSTTNTESEKNVPQKKEKKNKENAKGINESDKSKGCTIGQVQKNVNAREHQGVKHKGTKFENEIQRSPKKARRETMVSLSRASNQYRAHSAFDVFDVFLPMHVDEKLIERLNIENSMTEIPVRLIEDFMNETEVPIGKELCSRSMTPPNFSIPLRSTSPPAIFELSDTIESTKIDASADKVIYPSWFTEDFNNENRENFEEKVEVTYDDTPPFIYRSLGSRREGVRTPARGQHSRAPEPRTRQPAARLAVKSFESSRSRKGFPDKMVLLFTALFLLFTKSIVGKSDASCLTGSWTGFNHSKPDRWHSLSNQEYFIEQDVSNPNKLVFQSITDLGTGWSDESGHWDDYGNDPNSGAWGTGQGSLQGHSTIHAILDPGVDDPESTMDQPGGHYELRVKGTISENCTRIDWTTDAADNASLPSGFQKSWIKQQVIDKVHFVFMNHLDVGYAIHLYQGNPYGFVSNVLNTYQKEYIPRAISLQKTLRALNREERFIYTTQPWLVSLYIDCPPNFKMANGSKLYCPTQDELDDFYEAVKLGDITWHDGPFNLQPENTMNEFLLEAGLNISSNLNKRFDLKDSLYKTMSQRDVPSMTRAVIPILNKNGFKAISVGQNGDTPPLGFGAKRWVDPSSGEDIIWLNTPYGYPNSPGPSGKDCHGLCRSNCIEVEGFSEVLCFGFRSDNAGPPTSIEMLLRWYEIARIQFPGAEVRSSTFQNYIEALMPFKKTLPTVSSEAGDVWIQGIASDPYKMAYNRALNRVLAECVKEGRCDPFDKKIQNSTRLLLKTPEHTWGLPNIYSNGVTDDINWRNDLFEKARHGGILQAGYTDCEEGWREQRSFNNYALDALRGHPIYAEAKAAIDELRVNEIFITNQKQFSANTDHVTDKNQWDIENDEFLQALKRKEEESTVAASAISTGDKEFLKYREVKLPQKKKTVDGLSPPRPLPPLDIHTCGNVEFAIDTNHGGLRYYATNGHIWYDESLSSENEGFLQLAYYIYNKTDFDEMHAACQEANDGFPCGYGGYNKPGSETNCSNTDGSLNGCPTQQRVVPTLAKLYVRSSALTGSRTSTTGETSKGMNGNNSSIAFASNCSFVMRLDFPKNLHTKYGSPSHVYANLTVINGSKLHFEINLINKTATRLAESMALEFYPTNYFNPHKSMNWYYNKLSSWIQPFEVNQEFLGGNIWQHAVNKGVLLTTGKTLQDESNNSANSLLFGSLDAPLAMVGTSQQRPTPFIKRVQPLQQGDPTGMAFNLFNNIWNTNYIFYYPYLEDSGDENIKYRFTLEPVQPNELIPKQY